MSTSITLSELARLLSEALPVRGRVEITAGDPRSLAAGDHFVVTEESDGALVALIRAAEIGADGKTGDLNVKSWIMSCVPPAGVEPAQAGLKDRHPDRSGVGGRSSARAVCARSSCVRCARARAGCTAQESNLASQRRGVYSAPCVPALGA